METADFAKLQYRWREADFVAPDWPVPVPLEPVGRDGFMENVGLLRRFIMRERSIPLLYETHREFLRTRRSKNGAIILEAGKEAGGYPVFHFLGASETRVKFVYLEKFTGEGIRKDDAERGDYDGITDTLILNGDEITFEPSWYRKFRFIAIEIDETDVELPSASYRETGNPLENFPWTPAFRRSFAGASAGTSASP